MNDLQNVSLFYLFLGLRLEVVIDLINHFRPHKLPLNQSRQKRCYARKAKKRQKNLCNCMQNGHKQQRFVKNSNRQQRFVKNNSNKTKRQKYGKTLYSYLCKVTSITDFLIAVRTSTERMNLKKGAISVAIFLPLFWGNLKADYMMHMRKTLLVFAPISEDTREFL